MPAFDRMQLRSGSYDLLEARKSLALPFHPPRFPLDQLPYLRRILRLFAARIAPNPAHPGIRQSHPLLAAQNIVDLVFRDYGDRLTDLPGDQVRFAIRVENLAQPFG